MREGRERDGERKTTEKGRKRENSSRTFLLVIVCLSFKRHHQILDEITERAVYRHARTFRIVLNA